MLDLVLLLVGAAFLYFGAEWLVSGAAALALSLKIPALIVGLTVVAYGTSAPELIVGIQAAYAGHGDVALGNVIGSNIVNLGLILGLAAVLRPARIDGALQRRELPVMVLSALALPALLWDDVLSIPESIALLTLAVLYSAWMIRAAREPGIADEATSETSVAAASAAEAGAPRARGRLRQSLTALFGLAALLLGSHLFVDAASSLARAWGMSERILGLTIVAVGTSLPELATSTIAALRGHSEIAVGNVVGSNIFNVLLCLGGAGLSGTISARPSSLRFDLAALAAITLVGAISIRSARTMQRWEGALLLLLYGVFLLILSVTPA